MMFDFNVSFLFLFELCELIASFVTITGNLTNITFIMFIHHLMTHPRASHENDDSQSKIIRKKQYIHIYINMDAL